MVEEKLLIGQVARRAGLRPSAIRYYESIGLLAEPERIAGRRHYPPSVLRTLALIAAGQRAGLTLEELRELLTNVDAPGAVPEHLQAIARRKLPAADAMIARAVRAKTWLQMAAECCCPTLDDCPLFDNPPASTASP